MGSASDGNVCADFQQNQDDDKIKQIEAKDCRTLVQEWMVDHKNSDFDEESLRDFDAAVCLSGLKKTTALERLNAVVWVVSCDVTAAYEYREEQKLQPIVVAKHVDPSIKHWG